LVFFFFFYFIFFHTDCKVCMGVHYGNRESSWGHKALCSSHKMPWAMESRHLPRRVPETLLTDSKALLTPTWPKAMRTIATVCSDAVEDVQKNFSCVLRRGRHLFCICSDHYHGWQRQWQLSCTLTVGNAKESKCLEFEEVDHPLGPQGFRANRSISIIQSKLTDRAGSTRIA
jgi:hypothetical protein